MNNLVISYDNENDIRIKREYNGMLDFINEINSDNMDVPMLDYTNVTALICQNEEKHFATINDLYAYCMEYPRCN